MYNYKCKYCGCHVKSNTVDCPHCGANNFEFIKRESKSIVKEKKNIVKSIFSSDKIIWWYLLFVFLVICVPIKFIINGQLDITVYGISIFIVIIFVTIVLKIIISKEEKKNNRD